MDERASLQALSGRAAALRRAHRYAEAEQAYSLLLARWPDLADSWFNLGLVQRRLGKPEAALGAYQEAIVRGVAQPEEAHLNRAVIFSEDLHRSELAQAELGQALRLNPRYPPAWLNLGNLHEDAGERPQAEAAYEQALRWDPACWLALSRLAGLRGGRAGEDQLRGALTRGDLAQADRADLGFALGGVLDRLGRYAEAFGAYEGANAASMKAHGVRYDRQAHEALIASLMQIFPLPVASGSPAAPVFICGMFRSGSTLIEQVLAAHPEVVAGGELDILPRLLRERCRPYPAAAASLNVEGMRALADAYQTEAVKKISDEKSFTDKRPDNFLHIGMIKSIFPRAKIVHTVRNPLDTCLSIYFTHLDPSQAYATNISNIAHYYGQYKKLMDHWTASYPGDIFTFQYDAFVQAPRDGLERLLAFCGLSFEEGCLRPELRAARVRTASVWQVREPIHAKSLGRWRNYAAQIGPLRAALAEAGVGGL